MRGALAARRPRAAGLGLGLVLLVLALDATLGCEANKNYEARQAYADSLPDGDPPGCLGQCLPDPGSQLKDCLGEENEAEFEYLPIWEFKGPPDPASSLPGRAETMYVYDDDSAPYLFPVGWEPPTTRITRCQQASVPEWGFHILGGPFRDWGGGIGTSFRRLNSVDGGCSNLYPLDFCPPPGTEYPFDRYTIDVSDYEGISLWARRGPNSQPLLRVLLGDRRTDDDISFLMYEADPDGPRFCERNRECGCKRQVPCTETQVPQENNPTELETIFACYDPLTEPAPLSRRSYELCGDWYCDEPFASFPSFDPNTNPPPPPPFEPLVEGERVDPQFYGRSCNRHASRGGIVGGFCYEPDVDPDPYEGVDQCGDHWTYPIHLTTEWKFYKIPFTRLLQQGWAKEQPLLELNAASLLRFTWDKGYIDYWIDKVSFYRRIKPPAPEGSAGAAGQ